MLVVVLLMLIWWCCDARVLVVSKDRGGVMMWCGWCLLCSSSPLLPVQLLVVCANDLHLETQNRFTLVLLVLFLFCCHRQINVMLP